MSKLHASHKVSTADRPSKTRRKRDAREVQALGLALMALPETRLADLLLPEALLQAIQDLKRTRSREGKRRQTQFIGKLMRGIDPAPLREAVGSIANTRLRDTNDVFDRSRL